jgi:hypothetical protein
VVSEHAPACRVGEYSPHESLTMASRGQLEAVAQTMHNDLKFRADPFEWVYEGYAPLLLPDVLASR